MNKIRNITLVSIAIFTLYSFTYKKDTYTKAEKSAPNVLLVGTCADFPPYEKIDRYTRKIVGFDIDLVHEIANRLGLKAIIKDMPFNSLILNLATGKIDIVAAALSATEDRKKVVCFSNIYLYNDYAIVVTSAHKPPLKSLYDLHAKTIGINMNYAANDYLKGIPGIRLIEVGAVVDNAFALQSGTIDAFITSRNRYNRFIDQQGDAKMFQYFTIPNTAEHCAFAFAKNNHKLREQVNATLAAMKEDGTLEKIKQTWGFHD